MFLAMGMTYEQFWDGDPEIAVAYRKLDEINQERRNELAWQIGMYVYEAVGSIMSGKKKLQYPKEPHPLNTSISREKAELKKKADEKRFVDQMNMIAADFNRRFAEKQNQKKEQ